MHEKQPRSEPTTPGPTARVVRGLKTAQGWADFTIALVVEWWNTRRAPGAVARQEVLAAVRVPVAGERSREYRAYAAVAVPRGGRPRWFAWSGPLAVLFVAMLSVSQVVATSGVASAGFVFPEVVAAPVRLISSHTPAFVKQAPPRPAAQERAAPVVEEVVAEEAEPVEQVAAPPQPVQPPPQSSASAVPVAVMSVRLTEEELRGYALQAGWPEAKLDEVVQVAHCESRYLTSAIGGGALGLMQIMPFWFGVAGLPLAQWADPVTNLSMAKFIHDRQVNNGRDPWGPWACKPTIAPAQTETEGSAPAVVPAPAIGGSNAAEDTGGEEAGSTAQGEGESE